MWSIYVKLVKWAARQVAPTGARYILDPRGFRRAVATSVAAFGIALTPLAAPAQLGSQSVERTLIDHDARIRAVEKAQAEMVMTLSRVGEQAIKIEELTKAVNGLTTQQAISNSQMADRDRVFAWIFGILGSVLAAIIGAMCFWVIRHKKNNH